MKKYNHAFTLAFSIESDHPQGEDITSEEYLQALTARADDLHQTGEWEEALGCPYDTYENDPI